MADNHRLIIRFQRVTARDAQGNPTRHVIESFDLVHHDDYKGKKRGLAAGPFNEINAMLRGNPNYVNVTYEKAASVAA